MKRLLLIAGILLASNLALAQGSYVAFAVQSPTGAAIAGANVAVCAGLPTLATPCGATSLQATYTDATLTTACSLNPSTLGPTFGVGCTNPGLADGHGMVRLYANSTSSGTSFYQAYGQGIFVTDIEPIFFPGIASGANILPTNNRFTGNNVFGGLLYCHTSNNVRCIDPNNSAAWTGATIDAWIASASADMGASGGTIQVAEGLYTIAGTILGATNVNIQCAPFDSSVMTAAASFNAPLYSATNVNHFSMDGCVLDGNRASNVHGNDIIQVNGGSQAKITNNILRNTLGNGIWLVANDQNVDIAGNEIYNIGPLLPSQTVAINSGSIGGLPNSHIKIRNNVIHDGSLGIYIQPSQTTSSVSEDWDISGNTVYAMANDGIATFCSNHSGGPLRGVRTVNNEISCTGWPANGTGFNSSCTPGLLQTGSFASNSGVGIDYNCSLQEQGIISNNRSHDNFYEGIDVEDAILSQVDTSGTAVTWRSGDLFVTSWRLNQAVRINGSTFFISSCASTIACTLTASAGPQTNVQLQASGLNSRTTISNNVLYNNGRGNNNSSGHGAADVFGYADVWSNNVSYSNNALGFIDDDSVLVTHTGDVALNNDLAGGFNDGFLCDGCLYPKWTGIQGDDTTVPPIQANVGHFDANTTGGVAIGIRAPGTAFSAFSDQGTNDLVTQASGSIEEVTGGIYVPIFNSSPAIVSGIGCSASDQTCFSGVTANQSTYTITGTFNVTNTIRFINLSHSTIRCTPGTLFQPATSLNVPLVEIVGGSYVTLDGCEVAGLAYTTGLISVTNGSPTATLTIAPSSAQQTMMATGSDLYVAGSAPSPDTSSTHGQGGSFTTISGTSITLSANWAGRSMSNVPFRIAYAANNNLIQVVDEECGLGGGGSISGNGTLVTVLLAAAQNCNIRTGQTILVFGTGTLGSGASANSYNAANIASVTVISGCTGVGACSFTYPSTLNIGSATSGTIAIKTDHIHVQNNFTHDVTTQAIAIGSGVGATQDIVTQVWVEDNSAQYCGTSCISPNRMSHVHLSRNYCKVPAMAGNGGACFNLNQTIEGTEGQDEADVENAGIGLHCAFCYGGSFGDALDVHDVSLSNSFGTNLSIHCDTCINVKLGGATIGGGIIYGTANQGSGGTAIRYEVPSGGTIIGNAIQNVGGVGIGVNSRLENLGSGFNASTQNTSTASCVVAGASACGTPIGHQIFNADTQSAVTSVSFTSNGNNQQVTFTSGALTIPSGATCTSATTPECVTDTVNKLEGVASQKICPGNCSASTTFPAGRVVFMNFPCTTPSGNQLCNSTNGPIDLITLPVFRIGIGAPAATNLAAGDLQFCASSQPNLVAPEACLNVPAIQSGQFIYVSFIFPNFGQLLDNPGIQSAGFVAKSGGTGSMVAFWTDDWAVDVSSSKDAPVSITGNTIYRPQGACMAVSGGAIATITGNAGRDCGFTGQGPFPSTAIVVDNSLTGSQLIKGPPSVGGLISGNMFRNTLGLNQTTTCIALNVTNSGSLDRLRVNPAGQCVDAEWTTVFNPDYGGTLATNYAMQDQGKCTMSSGTCTGQTLSFNYTDTPLCFGNWTGSGTLTGILKFPVTSSFPTQVVTPASSVGSDTAVVTWTCQAN